MGGYVVIRWIGQEPKVMVNGPDDVYVERKGRIERVR
jgi:hypothetical protein